MSNNTLARSRHDAMLGGVCSGIARWLGWDPTLIRILYMVVSIISAAFPGILIYVLLFFVMPDDK